MRVHVLDDYDYDCEIFPEGTPHTGASRHPLYEVPDDVAKEFKEVSERLENLKDKIRLIVRQGPI